MQSLARAVDALNWSEVLVLLAVAASSTQLWHQRRSKAAGWLASGFSVGVLVIALSGVVRHTGIDPTGPLSRAALALLALWPYTFLRAAWSFGRSRNVSNRLAQLSTAVVVVGSIAVPNLPKPGQTPSGWAALLTVVYVLDWTVLSVVAIARLWSAGRHQPTVSRRRMRLLAVGGTTLTGAILLSAATTNGRTVSAAVVVADTISLVGVLIFFLAFSTPRLMRMLWRQHDLAAFHRAQAGLIGATTVVDVAVAVVPHAVTLVGGRGALVATEDGEVVARTGLGAEEAEELAGLVQVARPADRYTAEPVPGVLAVGLLSGYLVVQTHAQTPFFGGEEMSLLESLGRSADLALERARLLEAERETSRVLAESRADLAQAQHLARLGSWIWDLAEDRIYMSDEMYRLYQLEPADFELTHERVLERVHPDDRQWFVATTTAALDTGESFDLFHRLVLPDGVVRWVHLRGETVLDDDGTALEMRGTSQDVSDLKEAESELSVRARQQTSISWLGQLALEGSDLTVLMDEAAAVAADNLGTVMAAVLESTPGGALLVKAGFGLPAGTIGRVLAPDPTTSFRPPDLVGDAASVLSAEITGHNGSGYGALLVVTATERQFAPHDREFLTSLANVLAATLRRHRAEELLAHRALHDPLTGLPNWALVSDRLSQALQRSRRSNRAVAVVALDIDRFGLVNHELGHEGGDDLLVQVSSRLEGVLRPTDTLGRQGNDEFVVVAEDIAGQDDAAHLAQRLRDVFARPFVVGGRQVTVTASLGVATSDGRATAEALMSDANAALQQARKRGRAMQEFYAPSLRSPGVLDSENELRRAIDEGELRLRYQPEVRLSDGRIVGAEVLVRWQHPTRGLLAPIEFLDVAEDTGLVIPLGSWVLEAACQQSRAWRDVPELADLTTWVNLSARQFSEKGLVSLVERCLSTAGIEPRHLGLEITENVLMDDVETVDSTLAALRDLGVRLAVDDFGTGFSSLSYLRRFSVDVLKVDKSFVAGMNLPGGSGAIVGAVIEMAHSLGLSATAEGVETYDQVGALREMACDYAQGYYFAQPRPPEDFAALATSRLAALGQPVVDLSNVNRLAGAVVLVCDDDPVARRVFRVALESAGATVFEAADGNACVAIAAEHHPHVVLLDLFMPNRDGLSTLGELEDRAPGVRVALVSAFPTATVELRGVSGCFDKVDAVARLPELVASLLPAGWRA